MSDADLKLDAHPLGGVRRASSIDPDRPRQFGSHIVFCSRAIVRCLPFLRCLSLFVVACLHALIGCAAGTCTRVAVTSFAGGRSFLASRLFLGVLRSGRAQFLFPSAICSAHLYNFEKCLWRCCSSRLFLMLFEFSIRGVFGSNGQ